MGISAVSKDAVELKGGERIALTSDSTDASIAAALSGKVTDEVVYLHHDGDGEVDAVYVAREGTTPEKDWHLGDSGGAP